MQTNIRNELSKFINIQILCATIKDKIWYISIQNLKYSSYCFIEMQFKNFNDSQDDHFVFESKYLGENNSKSSHPNYSFQLKRQTITAEIQTINTQLNTITSQRIGNLAIMTSPKTDTEWKQIQKTIQLVKSLLTKIHKDVQGKNQLQTKVRKSQNQQIHLQNQIEKLTRDKKLLQNEKDSLINKVKINEAKFKDHMQKLENEKEQAVKQFRMIQSKQNQQKVQYRKLQNTIKQLQQKQQGKNTQKNKPKNQFTVIQSIQNYGPSLIFTNSQNQFNQFVVNNFEQTYQKLCDQNNYLKECLQNVYKQLQSLLQIKKNIIRSRRGFDTALQSDAFNLQNVRPDIFNLPKQYSKDGLNVLHENLSKFKEAIRIGEGVDQKVQDNKIECIHNVKQLIKNYKNIVQGQDQMLSKVILKAKQFKANQMSSIQSKYSKFIQEDQLEHSKRFLQEQRQILDSRNKQLQMTRRAMQNTLKKAEQQKMQFLRKKADTNQQLNLLKKNIQKIPALVQEQLRNII